MKLHNLLAVALVSSGALIAQTPATFEVASVKPQPWTGQGSVGVFVQGDTLRGEHVSLNDLVAFAYDLRDMQLSGGPAWADQSQAKLADAELYQVTAKAGGDVPPPTEVFRRMLQALLAERFHLQVHHVQKDFPVFHLVVSKGGAKLKESSADDKFSSMTSVRGRFGLQMVVTKMALSQLVDTLSRYAGRPVFDQTGLAAGYDFKLEFVSENAHATQDSDADGPSLFTAVQEQLGLRLESAVAPFDTVVVDHAERPTEN